MIMIVLILLGVIIYYYLNNSLYETFTSLQDDIVNKPEKTQHFVNLKQDKVFKNNGNLRFLKKMKVKS